MAMAMEIVMVMVMAMATAMANGNGKGNCNGNSNGNGKGKGDGSSRMAIGWWQLDDNNGTTTMWWQWAARNMASAAPPIKGKDQLMWTIWGGGDKRGGQFGVTEPQKRVKVELIEWRSIDLHSIDSNSTFRPPQRGKHMGTYSPCILGIRLRYWHHGEHVYCCRCLCHCCDGVIFVVDAKGSLPPSS